jgi:hypothetical protein
MPQTRRLNLAERIGLAAEILAAYVTARLALRRRPIESALARLRQASRPYAELPPTGVTFSEACRLGAAVARTLALAPGDTRCLVRSLVLTRLLARRGIPSTLVIGACSTPGFLAHAWVEHDGAAVLDPGDWSFARLVEL